MNATPHACAVCEICFKAEPLYGFTRIIITGGLTVRKEFLAVCVPCLGKLEAKS